MCGVSGVPGVMWGGLFIYFTLDQFSSVAYTLLGHFLLCYLIERGLFYCLR